jgi:hypothetical protein
MILHDEDQQVKEGYFHAKLATMPYGTAHDFSKNVAAALVRWQNSICDKKRSGAGMVGNDS